MLAAKQAGRPVKWTGTRSETISGDHHGRAADLTRRAGARRPGRFLGAPRAMAGQPRRLSAPAPARSSTRSRRRPRRRSASTTCRRSYGRHRLVFTNTTPTTAYRGAGRPNVAYLWERLVEKAAATLGMDPIRLRRRNLLKQGQFPYKTPTGSSYDSADPAGLLDTALKAADWNASRSAAAPPRSTACCAASGSRCSSSRPAASARRDRDQDHRRRQARPVFAGRPVGPGPRDGVSRPGRRRARHLPADAHRASLQRPRLAQACSAPAASVRAR